jgi:hypothetical protein
MPAAITTLRTTLATALTNAGVWSTFSFIPQTPIANSVLVVNDDPFIVVQSGQKTGIAPVARYRIYGLVPMLDNQGNQVNIEDFIVAIFAKLAASSLVMTVGSFSAPAILETPAGNLLQTEVGVEIISSWS